MWSFGNKESTSSAMNATDDAEVYNEILPQTMPVVKQTIDSLAKLAVSQRMFIIDHVSKVKLELLKEKTPTERSGAWALNGFALEDQDAVDFVRACPDALSNLTFVPYEDQTTLWTRISSWLKFKSPESRNLNIVDDLGYVLSVAEVIEIAGHLLAAVSYGLAEEAPKSGSPTRRQLAFELVSSRHRGNSHSMYLISEIVHTAERVASHNSASTMSIASSLYIYKPLLLGGLKGAAVNVSGTRVDDLPMADLDRDEMRDLLSKKGRFVSSSTSNFVLDPQQTVTSERASKIATMSCEKLVNAANRALVSFFAAETEDLEMERQMVRKRAAEIAKQEEMERQMRLKEEEELAERRMAMDQQLQQQRSDQGYDRQYDRYGQPDAVYYDEYDDYDGYN